MEKLFNYMFQEHGIMMLDTDLQEVKRIVLEDFEDNQDEDLVFMKEVGIAFQNGEWERNEATEAEGKAGRSLF